MFIRFNSASHKLRRLPVFLGLLNNQWLRDKSSGGYSQDVVSASNCPCGKSWRLSGRGGGRRISSESINQLIGLHSFLPTLEDKQENYSEAQNEAASENCALLI